MRTLVGVVLDRSGSMSDVLDDTIGGFNSLVEEQRKAGNDQVYVIAQFDNEYEVLQDGVELDDVLVLDRSSFVPRGGTALLDAMGRTIHALDAVLDSYNSIDRVIMVTLTDGGENISKEFSRKQVNNLIEKRKNGGIWDFNFLGANQDAIAVGTSLGVSMQNCANYQQTAGGTLRAFNAVSRSVESYSTGESSAFTPYKQNS
jgi:hypothetical protein